MEMSYTHMLEVWHLDNKTDSNKLKCYTDKEDKVKKLVFAVAAYNLAEVGRMVEIAKEARLVFEVEFLTYGGVFEEIIKSEGFKIRRLQPEITPEKLEELKRYLNGDAINTLAYFSKEEIELRVASEIEYLSEYRPDAVVTGWNLTTGISARYLGIHFVNVLHSTSVREYYLAGLQSYPDYMDNWFINLLLPPAKRTAIFNKRVLNAGFPVKRYNDVLKKYGLPSYKSFIDYIEGDTTLLADIPEWVSLSNWRPSLRHIGPLPAQLNVPVPEVLNHLDKSKPVVYFAMGSSGKKELVKEILEGFEGKPYTVIAPVKKLVEDLNIQVPSNVVVTGFIPAHKVNPLADVSVLHGGQNTVMNACLSGTPFVGVGMHVEQQANIDACVRKGFAIRLSKKSVTSQQVLEAIDQLVTDKEAKNKILEFKDALDKWNGPQNAVKVLQEVLHVEQINQKHVDKKDT